MGSEMCIRDRLVDLGVELSLEKIAEELAATLAGRLGRVAMTQA